MLGYYTLFSLVVLNLWTAFGNPVVNTKYGPIEGVSVPVHTGQIIDTFMAVPFARPPVDDLRFMPPQEPIPWNETLLAHEPGNACMQELITGVFITHWGWEKFGEDCLTLNIYTPQIESDELLPVLVFIHGGDFMNGANFIYPGYIPAAYGVVVVTVNYRLNILGFATTEDEVMPGNLGLHDQVLAFRFIQENIAEFGGDPSRVTISGESAGAASVGLQLVSSVSQGLFQQAIMQSGSELDYWVLQGPEQQPSNYLRQVADVVNCTTETSEAMVDCLRTIDAQRLVAANYECTEGYDCGTFRPTIDGIFLTDYPSELRSRGEYIRVPEIIGVNQDEGSMWLFEFPEYGQDIETGLNRTAFDNMISDELTLLAPSWPDPERLNDAIQAVRYYYADWPYFNDLLRNREMFITMYSDLFFGHSADFQAKSQSRDMPVFFYVYDYVEENGIVPDHFGTYHAAELSFTFGWPWLYLDENEAAYNHSQTNPRNDTTFERTDKDRDVSDFMMTLWTNFAIYGNPTPEPVGPGDESEITWPQYSPGNFSYAYLSDNPDVRIDYRQQNYAFWQYYLEYITHGEEFVNVAAEDSAGRKHRRLASHLIHS